MTENEQLKPCPFCGGKAEVFINNVDKLWNVCCYDEYNDYDCCGVEIGDFLTEQEAIKAWNTRVNPTIVCPEKQTAFKLNNDYKDVYDYVRKKVWCSGFNEAIDQFRKMNEDKS